MQYIFRAYERSIAYDDHMTSHERLASFMMMTSLKLSSPITSSPATPWQAHLEIAAQIINVREGDSLKYKDYEVNDFLLRWFAQIEITGTLCGQTTRAPIFANSFRATATDDD